MNQIPIYLAPMQGYTDHIYRMALQRCFGGVDKMFTPFMRLENGELRSRDRRELVSLVESEPYTVPQILPGNEQEMETLCRLLVANGVHHIDINMCCPFPPVVKSGRGAGLLADVQRTEQVLAVTNRFPDVTFSLKMRLGIDDISQWKSLMPIVNDTRLDHVTMHSRTATQQYGGEADMDMFAEFFASCAHPCVYNGDVRSMEQVEYLAKRFPELYAVMIGRAIVADPRLLVSELPQAEQNERLVEFYDTLSSAYEDRLCGAMQWLDKMQSFWRLFLPDADRKLRKKILKTRKPEAFRAYASELLASL